jgi:A/G-specific adenine glycosylase
VTSPHRSQLAFADSSDSDSQYPATLEATALADTEFDYAGFARHLYGWFTAAQRDLPWRHEANARDPYRVIVSEFMLQQTTVAAVIPYYERFIARFPDIATLAAASLEDVLPFWAGLGYYTRVRNLHALAQAVMQQHGGHFPQTLSDVLALPGVGRYTAGAVTSIAFDSPSPIVDANVARVFSRLFLIEGDLKNTTNQARLWSEAVLVVERGAAAGCPPSQLNPAIMELGALICTPKNPRCPECPVAAHCAARATGRQDELPFVPPKPKFVEMHDVCVFIQKAAEAPADLPTPADLPSTETDTPPGEAEHRIWLRQRPHDAKIWWRGMWELPRTTLLPGESPEDAVNRLVRNELKLQQYHIVQKSHTLKHGVTTHKITLDCYVIETPETPHNAQLYTSEASETLAIPSTMRRLLEKMKQCAEQGKVGQTTPTQPALW